MRLALASGLLLLAALGTPAGAVTAAEKMETCKFGADAQKLTGAKRKSFLARCMADSDAPARRAKAAPKG
jgi:hypothetical protein